MRKEHESIQLLSVLSFTSASSNGEIFSHASLSRAVSVVKGTFRPVFSIVSCYLLPFPHPVPHTASKVL